MGQIWQNSIPYSGAGSTDYLDLTTTLTAGSTVVTILNNVFKDDSVVDLFTDPYGVIPTNAIISPGVITITFRPQSIDVEVLVRVYKEKGGSGNYTAGRLIDISAQHQISVNMLKSTVGDIAQQSAADPNTLYFTEGSVFLYTTRETLFSNSWSESLGVWYQDVTIYGITQNTNILVSPVSDNTSNFDDYCNAGIRAYSQTSNLLKFRSTVKPTSNLAVVIAYWE